MKHEDKQLICDELARLLKFTRGGDGIGKIKYVKNGQHETATIIFSKGFEVTVNVTADSGIAMIKDILKPLG